MQQITAMMRKEFLLWAQKPGSWIVIFVVPLLFIWVMQAVFGSNGSPVVTVYAVNQDKGEQAEQVMQALKNAANLEIEELKTREEADRRVGAGDRMAAVIVPYGFSRDISTPEGAVLEIIIDPAQSEKASIVSGLVNSALSKIIVDAEVSRGVENGVAQVMKSANGGSQPVPEETNPQNETIPQDSTPSPDGANSQNETTPPDGTALPDETTTPDGTTPQDGTTSQNGTNPALSADDETLTKFFTAAMKGVVSSQVQDAVDNPQVKLAVQPFEVVGETQARRPSLLDYLIPGYSLMFVFFLISNLSVSLVQERHIGTLRRLLIAPVPRSRILLGKMLPFFLIAVVQLIFVLTISKFLFNIDLGGGPRGSILALGVIIFASALAMACLGILIASLARSETQADNLSVVLVVAMAVISGAMFPSIFIPGLQNLTPHYWAMQGFLNIIARAQGIQGALLPAGVLITMSAVFFTIGAVRFQLSNS